MATLFATQLTEKKKERKAVHDKAIKLVTEAKDKKREMTSEEKQAFDQHTEEIKRLSSEIEDLKVWTDFESNSESDDTDNNDESRTDDEKKEDEKRKRSMNNNNVDKELKDKSDKFDLLMRAVKERGFHSSDTETKRRRYEPINGDANYDKLRTRRNSKEYRDAFVEWMRNSSRTLNQDKLRAVQADVDIIGGYMVMPEIVSDKILKAVDNQLFMQQKGTVFNVVNAQSLGVPSIDTDISDSEWTTEISPINADNDMRFGKRALTPHPMRKRVLVSSKFLRAAFSGTFWSNDDESGAGGSPENIIINRLAYKHALPRERAYMTGNGVGQPLGVFTASARGVSTARDVVTGSATGYTYAGLLRCKYNLKSQYHNTAEWIFHRLSMEKIMGLVDDNNRPLLNFSTLPDQPTTLLNRPVNLSELAPSALVNGAYGAILGDLSYYAIAQSVDILIKRLEELYAETDQVGFIGTAEADGMPMLEEAYSRMKFGT